MKRAYPFYAGRLIAELEISIRVDNVPNTDHSDFETLALIEAFAQRGDDGSELLEFGLPLSDGRAEELLDVAGLCKCL